MAVIIHVEGLPVAQTVNYYVRLTYDPEAEELKWISKIRQTPQGDVLFTSNAYATRLEATLAASDFIETLHGI